MRLLLLSASAGAGHTRAAQALEETAKQLSGFSEIRHVDILDFTSKLYRKAYAGSYLRMIDNAPEIWGYLYQKTNRVREDGWEKKFTRIYDKVEFAGFRNFVREFKPDAVISTHFLTGQIFAPYRRKNRDTFPLAYVITDFDTHAFWVEKTVDRYFVASDEIKAVLAGKGIEEKRISVTGIPIMPAFSKNYDAEVIRKKLGLSSKIPTVLIMSGGAGVGSMEETVQVTLESGPVQVLAVAGKNEALKKKLEKLRPENGSTIHAFGFVNTIAEMMSVSDLAITKSGGLSTSECLAMSLPMIVREPVPGQEERNCDFVVEAGAGVRANGVDSLRYKLKTLLADRNRLQRMRLAARSVGKPDAASTILKSTLSR